MVKCDVAIIGGGIAGLWCGYHAIKAGQKVVILEAKKIGSGVTCGSTAIFTYAQDIIYTPLIKKHGFHVAKKYLADTKSAMSDIKQIIRKEKLDCDLQEIDFVLFSRKTKGSRALNKELKSYRKLKQVVGLTKDIKLPYKIKRGLKFEKCFQVDPKKLCKSLAAYIVKSGGQIFEDTLVTNPPKENTLAIGDKIITANNFIVATHFPYINLPGFYWLKMYQSQNYCIEFSLPKSPQSKNLSSFCNDTSYESIDQTGFEYRCYGDNILIDGVSTRTGTKPKKPKYKKIEKHLNKYFPGWESAEKSTRHRWVAQDCITMDHLPYAGKYSRFQDNVFVVSGFNKWGMTNSYIAAKVVTDLIENPDGKSENIYCPQRPALFIGFAQTLQNVGVIAGSFLRLLGGAKKCPHMGCALRWNKDEKTWDCPCHGSRFDCKGEIINNPSTEKLDNVK